jgi:hypothetical protein
VYHVPTWHRPLDLAFIHAPVRLFLILPLSVLFPYSLLYVFFPPIRIGREPNYHIPVSLSAMDGIPHTQIKVTGISGNIFGILIIALRHDWVWFLGATWVCVSIWLNGPEPKPIYVCLPFFLPNLPLRRVDRLLPSSSQHCIQSRSLARYLPSTSQARGRRVESVFSLTMKQHTKGTHQAGMKSRQIGARYNQFAVYPFEIARTFRSRRCVL